ncbi:MAG: metalloregulator ArsR/SmtB family transcription factor [Candidatus Latescibacteria bacterium]|nr:metalloregulator ArsR/SmtB family transcription factor [Candidatus Latescibacterota bacterium]
MAYPLKIYKALADETRLRLLRLLQRGPLNVNELIGILRMGQSRISRHLKILSEAGLVTFRREGTWIYYQTAGDVQEGLVADTLAHLRGYETELAHYTEDVQNLEGLIESRKARTRTFFDNIDDPGRQLQHQSLDGQYYRQVALEQTRDKCAVALDMGTGAGLLLAGLLQRAERVIAVDASEPMLELARRTAADQIDRVDFRLGELEHLPVADGEVDTVMACMVLHHLSHPLEALREAHRALKPGGQLCIVDLHQHDDESLRERLADLWLGFLPEEVEGWLQALRFTVAAAAVVGAPDSLKLITFQGRKL